MVYLELGDFFILISCNSDKLTFFKHVGSEGRVGELQDVAGPHQVEPRLVLVHRVQDCLEEKKTVNFVHTEYVNNNNNKQIQACVTYK